MITLSDLEKYDPSGMYKVYDQWPKIAKDAYHSELEPIDIKNIDHVVFCGMGGSGSIGDLFSSILSKTDLHVNISKGYHLPNTVDENTLVVTTSVSGNTVETLTNLKSTLNLKCKVINFSSGGLTEQFCLHNNIKHRKISCIHSPRASFPNYVYSMLKVLNDILQINTKDIVDSIHVIEKLSQKISSPNLNSLNPSLNLSNWLNDIPIIYYPWGLQSAAIRFKNSLQENAKSHVMVENVIESCHNGITSWEQKTNVQPILLKGQDDYFKTKERWEILKKYFDTNSIQYYEVDSVPGSILSKLIHMMYLLDYSSIYFAIKHKINPTSIDSINFIKNQLSDT
jgi:glucose/mannose-6-phosphate isomerase